MAPLRLSNHRRDASLLKKLWQVNWGMALVLSALACIGFSMLYSAAGGDLEPWAIKQIWRFGIGFPVMIAVAVIDIRHWYRFAYGFYGAALLLLVAVELQGVVGMGAQRWLNIGPMQLQPSELIKIALTLALARWFNDLPVQFVGRFLLLIPPLLLLALPVALVAKQPDLGTSLMLIMTTGAIFFAAGVRWWKFLLVIAIGAVGLPFAWESNLIRDYQKARVRVFLDPGLDPLGAGYHIIQSKIALGSGGVTGKGFLQGTQSHLNFLPEKQTDFIFTMLAEEFGLIGCALLLGMYAVLLIYGYAIAFRSTSQFGRLMALGLITSVFLSVFINAAMVMGMIPAKGVPLPMVSYGGSSMIVTMLGFGLIMNGWIHRDTRLGRRGLDDE